MNPRHAPSRPARVVALALIAVAVGGLAYLRFAPARAGLRARPAPRPAT